VSVRPWDLDSTGGKAKHSSRDVYVPKTNISMGIWEGNIMEKQKSFTKIEQEVRHNYRKNLNIADSTEDVKKFFVYAVQDFIERAFDGRITVEFDDISLDREAEEGFICGTFLRENKEFMQCWENSDLPKIIGRLAENAINHIKHLEEKLPDKTEAKMYPTPSHSGRRFTNLPQKKGR